MFNRALILASILLTAGCTEAGALTGRVTHVYDGDTVSLAAGGRDHRVRLQGIDAPEHDQPYGAAAERHLAGLVLNKEVRLEQMGKDQYGRLLGKLWVQPRDCKNCGMTLDANLAMLTVGLAWWYRFYKDEQSAEDRGRYEFAEQEARAKRAGLWADANPTPPWDWKRGDRARQSASGDCRIKGNISDNGRIYHVPGQKYYAQTRINTNRGERWFCSAAEAEAAGWRRSRE